MVWPAAGLHDHKIEPQVAIGKGGIALQESKRSAFDAQPLPRGQSLQGQIPLAAPLDLDEGDELPLAGDEVDLPDRAAPATGQDTIALEPQPPGGRPLGPESLAIGAPTIDFIPRHRAPG